jgi:hypothetical protein
VLTGRFCGYGSEDRHEVEGSPDVWTQREQVDDAESESEDHGGVQPGRTRQDDCADTYTWTCVQGDAAWVPFHIELPSCERERHDQNQSERRQRRH